MFRVFSGQVRPDYDWEEMRRQGRNIYGTPEECIRGVQAVRENYDFDIFSATFNFGGIPHEHVLKAMRLFAKEVMPAFKDEPQPAGRNGASGAREVSPT